MVKLTKRPLHCFHRSSIIRYLLIVMLGALVIPGLSQAAEVQAVVDRTRIGLNESLRLNVVVSGGKADIDVSGISDFKIISSGTSSSVKIINSDYSRETTYQYVLLPLKAGDLMIPELPVTRKGKTTYTQAIPIRVSRSAPDPDTNRTVFVTAGISDDSVYQGQPLIYTFRFLRAVQVANAQLEKPEFKDFSAQKIDGMKRSYETVLSGRRYVVTEITYALMPLKTGTLEIAPAVLSCDVATRNRRRSRSQLDSFFDDSFFNRGRLERRVLQSEPLTVTVKPLPPYSGDVRFSGLVGRIDFKADIENTELTVGDSTTLSLTLSGSGNIMDAEAPVIRFPDAFKIYEDTPDEKIEANADGYAGHKTFRIALVPVKAGQYKLDPVRFCYFDAFEERYKTIASSGFTLQVNPSDEPSRLEVTTAGKDTTDVRPDRKKVEFTGRDILPLKEDLDALDNRRRMSAGRFVALILLPALLYVVLRLGFHLAGKNSNPEQIFIRKARTALKTAADESLSTEEFLSLLYKSMTAALCGAPGASGRYSSGASLTGTERLDILKNSGFPEDLIQQTLDVFNRIESSRYSGTAVDSGLRRSLLSDTQTIIRRLAS